MSRHAQDVDAWLRGLGWTLDRIRGSHHTYKHARYRRSLGVVYHGRAFEPWQINNLLADLRRIAEAEGPATETRGESA